MEELSQEREKCALCFTNGRRHPDTLPHSHRRCCCCWCCCCSCCCFCGCQPHRLSGDGSKPLKSSMQYCLLFFKLSCSCVVISWSKDTLVDIFAFCCELHSLTSTHLKLSLHTHWIERREPLPSQPQVMLTHPTPVSSKTHKPSNRKDFVTRKLSPERQG